MRDKYLSLGALAFVFLFIGSLGFSFFSLIERLSDVIIPFDTDEADHANAALDVYRSLHHPLDFIEALRRQAFYPPVHSLFVTLSYLVFGPTLFSSRMPSLVFWLLSTANLFLLISWSVRRHQPGLKVPLWPQLFGATLASYLFANTRLLMVNSLLCMLELCALFFVTLLLLCLQRTEINGWTKRVYLPLILSLVFLAKYSIGIMTLPGVFLAMLYKREERQQMLWLVPTTLGICLLWPLLSDPYSFWKFLVGHPSYSPVLSTDNLFFYPRAWASHYSINPSYAAVSVVLAGIGARSYWSQLPTRAASGIIICSLLVLSLSTTNEVRHIMSALPAMYYLVGLGISQIALWMWKRGHHILAAVLFTSLFAACVLEVTKDQEQLPKYITRIFEGHHSYRRFHRLVVEQVHPKEQLIACGLNDQFGREALMWSIARTHPGVKYRDIRLDTYPFNPGLAQRRRERKRVVDLAYQDQTIPRAPFSAVIESGKYDKAILFRTVKNPRNEECITALSAYPKAARAYGNRAVSVFNLKRRNP